MQSLFSTSSDKAGFRLQYMEVYNWGTFYNDKVFRIGPKGNNSLLTGANASGKSSYIDALLTLMVPAKKDRFTTNLLGLRKKEIEQKKPTYWGTMAAYSRKGSTALPHRHCATKRPTLYCWPPLPIPIKRRSRSFKSGGFRMVS